MATDTSKTARAVIGVIFIVMPISVMTAVSGNIVYSSGIATGSSFVAVFGAFLEIIGFLGIAVSIYTAVKGQKDLKNKEGN